MFNRKKHTLHLSMFAFFLCSYSIISAQTIGMLAWLVPISVISIIQLIKDYHDIQRKDLLTACFLSLIVLANNTILSIAVFPAYLSATTMLHSSYDIPFLFTDKTIAKAQLRKTLLCLMAGILLAVLNLLLSNSYRILIGSCLICLLPCRLEFLKRFTFVYFYLHGQYVFMEKLL